MNIVAWGRAINANKDTLLSHALTDLDPCTALCGAFLLDKEVQIFSAAMSPKCRRCQELIFASDLERCKTERRPK